MSYRRTLTRWLDRPGGRFLLGKIATHVVQQCGAQGVEIAYRQGMWTRRCGSDFFPDSPSFDYEYVDFGRWKRQMEQYVFDSADYWLDYYCPQQGDLVIDVGAGHGEDTIPFSRAVGPTGRVIAIEAHPVSFAVLKNSCRLNHLGNVTPLHCAAMDQPGTVRIKESKSSWLLHEVDLSNSASGIAVPARTLDEICDSRGVRSVAFLKMNIEGAERQALLGMTATLPWVQQICVACHDFRATKGDGEHFRTRAFVEQFLLEHGFTLASRTDDPRDYVRDHVFGLRPGSSSFTKVVHKAADARSYVGTNEISGQLQLELLKREGCKPDSTVLEIGCGSLHAAVPLVEYLEAGRYVGIDPNSWLREAAMQDDRVRQLMERKQARFLSASDFDASSTHLRFDFVLSHSVLSHAAYWQLGLFLQNTVKVLAPAGRILASIRLAEGNAYGSTGTPDHEDSKHETWQYPGVSWFKLATVEAAATKYGLSVRHVPEYTEFYTRARPEEYHDWLVLQRAGN